MSETPARYEVIPDDPWDRVMIEVGCHVFGPGQALSAARDGDVAFQPSGMLLRSLGRRIFDGPPPEYAIEWIHARVAALALVGVERPGLLPFLKFVPGRAEAAGHDDPVAALEGILRAAGIEPGALKRLALWGFRSFEGLGARWVKPAPIASLANLLLRLDVQARPPPGFAEYALRLALHGLPEPPPVPDFGRHPLWFMRALFRAFASAHESGAAAPTREEAVRCVNWVIDTRPAPDANQQHAGWPWIVQQANAHAKARMLAGVERPWPMSIGERVHGRWRVVPIRSCAELDAEAAAMRNCLKDYLLDCLGGQVQIYSIRDQLTGERMACFSVVRDAEGGPWELEQIAGIANAEASDEMAALALRLISEMERP